MINLFPWILIGVSIVLLVLSFFSLPFIGFPVWSLALLVLGIGIGLLCSRKVSYKIVAKDKGTR
jgi:hypothetical protein|nr:MAG TPA: virulence factor membrane-bound polymerase [Inoviridae sp.]